MNIEDRVEREYNIAEMEPLEILSFGHTRLVMRLIKGALLNDIPPATRTRILEIGSGTCHGSYLVKMPPREHNFVVATDVSSSALRAGRKLERVFSAVLDGYVCCDCTRLPFRDGTFELVFGSAVLHHLQRPAYACLEIKRVLCPDGKYIGIEGVVTRRLRPLVRVFTGAYYRIVFEGVREDMYDSELWQKMFAEAGMHAIVEPLILPAAYKDLIGVKVMPISYRPRYKLRYTYEKILSVLPGSLVRMLIRILLPATVVIEAKGLEGCPTNVRLARTVIPSPDLPTGRGNLPDAMCQDEEPR